MVDAFEFEKFDAFAFEKFEPLTNIVGTEVKPTRVMFGSKLVARVALFGIKKNPDGSNYVLGSVETFGKNKCITSSSLVVFGPGCKAALYGGEFDELMFAPLIRDCVQREFKKHDELLRVSGAEQICMGDINCLNITYESV